MFSHFLNKIGISCLKIEIEKNAVTQKHQDLQLIVSTDNFFVKHVKINFDIMQSCQFFKNV